MKKHLFLTGPSGCGKSTLIRSELASSAAYAGGFITERMTAHDGTLLGYDLFPAAVAAGRDGYDGLRFLDYTVNPPAHDNEVFRVQGVRMLNESVYYPFVLLDEFGGFEMLVPQFRGALAELLNSDRPIIGVLKAPANADELKRRLGLGDRFTMMTENLRQVLSADEDTVLLEMHTRGEEAVRRIVHEWVREYA